METKEYIVILKKGFNYDEVWADIESPTSGLPHIPDRPVSIINDLNAFERQCSYELTDEEAEKLGLDPRVAGVEIPIEQMPGIEIIPFAVQQLIPTPAITTKLMNWTQTNGDLTLFVEGNNFTGWIGDITKANFLIDSTERSSIVNNATMRQELKKIGPILNTNVPDSSINSFLNSIVDAFNYQIDLFLGSKTQAICAVGQPAIYTTATSLIQDGKKYTRTTLRTSQINYGLNAAASTLPPTNVIADAFIDAVVAANNLVLSATQRSALKSVLIVVFELILGIVRSISDNVDLYDYTVETLVTASFNKPANGVSSGTNINWGLPRHINSFNAYGPNATTTSPYPYVLDGTGVDVVISDSGIQANHPEFTDANGGDRVAQINWATHAPAVATMGSPYQDLNGHGTHVAGTVAGKTHGWAKNARIYSILAYGTGAPTVANQFTAIKLWHLSKNGSRPTVVNMSWGPKYPWYELGGLPSTTLNTDANVAQAMINFISTITSVTYQGNVYSGNANLISRGLLLDPTNLNCIRSFRNGFPVWTLQTEDQVQTLIDAGIIVVSAAGNNSYKINKPTNNVNDDYNNKIYSTRLYDGNQFYQRGQGPHCANSINVGSIDSVVNASNLDQKAIYSCTGPGIDIYAAGTDIMSCTTSITSATGYKNSAPYFLNENFRQSNSSGTSMASPQVAGMCALYLQRNPTATPAEVKSWVTKSGQSNLYSTGLTNDYTNFRSTLGGAPKIAFQNILGLSYVKDQSGAWKPVNRKYVKTETGWKPIAYSYIKQSYGWVRTTNPM